MLVDDDEALLCELQTVMCFEALDLAAGHSLPRAQVPDAIWQRAERAGIEVNVQALVVDGQLRSASSFRLGITAERKENKR